MGLAAAFAAVTFAGFAPSYFLRGLSDRPPLSPLLHLHGVVFTSWLLLLLVQTTLVASHRVRWHRRMGIGGAVLAALMVPLGIWTAIAGAREGYLNGAHDALQFLIFPLSQMLMFGAAIGAALWMRRQPAIHRRFIVLSTAIAVTPALSRLPFVPNPMVSLVLSTLFVAAAAIHEWRSSGRVHPIYLAGGAAILLSGPVRFMAGQSELWQTIARALVA